MSEIDRTHSTSRPATSRRWKHLWRKLSGGEIGFLGSGLRWVVLLAFALYFFIPILWLTSSVCIDETIIDVYMQVQWKR